MKVAEKRKKRIERMLVSFIPLFSQYGMDKTTIKMLAGMEGCNEALLYQFFADKDDIIAKCTAYHHEKIQNELVGLMIQNLDDLEEMSRVTLKYVIRLWMSAGF